MTNKKSLIRLPFLTIFISILLFTSCSTLKSLVSEPSLFESISALKEILNSSAFRAIRDIKKVNDGGIAALLPEELRPILGTLKTMGLGEDVDIVTAQIEKASLLVAEESAGIMKDAISEVKFGDAVAVILGGENAATEVLRQAMYGSVKKRYSSRLDQELEKSEVKQYWPAAASAYNLFSSKKVDSSLSDFLAERAVDGLFLTMGKEEKEIRKDPASLGIGVVTKVFDYYQKKKRS